MNITYLFGNGFDRHIGLDTSYQSFYNYYVNQPSSTPIIQSLKNSMVANSELWSDFEVGLGEFCGQIENSEELSALITDVESALTTYLDNEDIKYTTDDESIRTRFISDLLNYDKYLNTDDLEQYRSKISKGSDTNIEINIITFNYTHSIESILGNSLPINVNDTTVISHIEHVHGELNDIILFGVDNTSQIHNASLQNDLDVADLICKPNINVSAERGSTVRMCEDIIYKTDVFVLFGLSCGDTDANWWQLIADRLGEGDYAPYVLLFSYEENPIERRKLSIYKRNIKDKILNHLSESFSRDFMEEYYEFMSVPINRGIFKCVKGMSINGSEVL